MLSTAVAIIGPSFLGAGQYSFALHFEDGSKAQFIRALDTVKDNGGNEYRLDTWVGSPSDFVSGASVTVTFLTTDTTPAADTGFDSTVFTPDQVDRRPVFQTTGQIGNISDHSGQDYEYALQASWDDLTEADNAIVGDKIVDSDGKEFAISYLAPTKFAVAFRVVEVEKVGIAPQPGASSVYRSTSLQGFYQGSALSDPARTNIFNRDKTIIDEKLGTGGAASLVIKSMKNDSGGTLSAGTPVSKLADGSVVAGDSDAANGQNFCGVTAEEILDGAFGDVALPGPNIAGAISGLGYTPGEDIFLSEDGGYTNDGGSFTGSDDSIIKVGVADCAAGVKSATATDLIMFSEVLIRP